MNNLEWLLKEAGDGVLDYSVEYPSDVYWCNRNNEPEFSVHQGPPKITIHLDPRWCEKEANK